MVINQASERRSAILNRGTGKAFSAAWFGGLRTSTGSIPTDRLFTGQIRDLGDDRFSFFRRRYYDATIGKFHVPDSVVPGATNPQALNRYAYALNNPLKLVDPSGHEPSDPQWRANFIAQHGYSPTDRDWQDFQFSLSHPGSGPNGTWTDQDWRAYSQVRSDLGPGLLREIGRRQDVGEVGGSIADTTAGAFAKGVPWVDGPDGTRIYLGGEVPHSAAAWTFGNNIIIGKDTIARLNAGRLSLGDYRALIIHEYVNVLQFRRLKAGFLPDYIISGADNVVTSGNARSFGNAANPLEAPAYAVQAIYSFDPGLAAPWEFSL